MSRSVLSLCLLIACLSHEIAPPHPVEHPDEAAPKVLMVHRPEDEE